MRKAITIAAAAVASLTVLSGVAMASIPGPDGVIHACRKNNTGDLRVIDSEASCPSGYTAMNWQVGGGLSQVQTIEDSVDIPANYSQNKITVTVRCPSGTNTVGGGGRGPETPDGAWVIYQSAPLRNAGQTIGWYVQLIRVGTVYESQTTAFGYALCAS